MKLDKNIIALLEKSIPKEAYEILKKKVETLDQLEKDLGRKEKQIEKLKEEKKELQTKIWTQDDLKNERERFGKLKKEVEIDQKKLADDKQKFEIFKRDDKIRMLERNVEFIKETAMGLVRNAEYRKKVVGEKVYYQDQDCDAQGNYVGTGWKSQPKETTENQEAM